MRRLLRAPWVWLIAAIATAAGVLAISSATDDGGGGAGKTGAATTAPPARIPADRQPGSAQGRGQGSNRHQVRESVKQSASPRLNADERRVAAIVRDYVGALNARDGARTCALFVSGALSGVDFPRDRGSCAASLSASVGYRDPRGFPVYDRSRVARIPRVAISGSEARVTATIVTRFAGGREPSVEDDLIYLRRAGSGWLIVKPSATLYRAIGVGIIPPQAIAPPR